MFHLGQNGCGVGRSIWKLLCSEHGIGPEGRMHTTLGGQANDEACNIQPYFVQYKDHVFKPRCLFFDTDPAGEAAQAPQNRYMRLQCLATFLCIAAELHFDMYRSLFDTSSLQLQPVRVLTANFSGQNRLCFSVMELGTSTLAVMMIWRARLLLNRLSYGCSKIAIILQTLSLLHLLWADLVLEGLFGSARL